MLPLINNFKKRTLKKELIFEKQSILSRFVRHLPKLLLLLAIGFAIYLIVFRFVFKSAKSYAPGADTFVDFHLPENYPALPRYFERYFQTYNVDNLFEDYIAFHKESLAKYKEDCESSGVKFLIFRPWETAGLANVLIGLSSTFVMALLSERVFLVDWPGHYSCKIPMTELFQNPDPDFKWDYIEYSKSLDSNKVCKTKLATNNLKLEVTHRGDETDFTFGMLKCTDFRKVMNDYGDVVQMSANQYFTPSLYINSNFGKLLSKIFTYTSPDQKDAKQIVDVFGPVSRFLFKPLPDLQKEIDAFVDKHNMRDIRSNVFAIQIRRNEKETNGDWFRAHHEPHFFECAVKNVIQKKLEPEDFSNKNYKILVLSDNSTVRTHAAQYFGDDKVIYYENAILDFSRNKDSVKSALIDAWILGHARGYVVSKFSTFGNLGHGRASIIPWVVTKNRDQIWCSIASTPEPEFHWGFRNDKIACNDWKGGVKGYPAKV